MPATLPTLALATLLGKPWQPFVPRADAYKPLVTQAKQPPVNAIDLGLFPVLPPAFRLYHTAVKLR